MRKFILGLGIIIMAFQAAILILGLISWLPHWALELPVQLGLLYMILVLGLLLARWRFH